MDLRKELIEKIKNSGLKNCEISAGTKITQSSLSNYLRGKTDILTKTYEKIYGFVMDHQRLYIPADVIDSDICNCEQKGRTVWKIGASGRCLRCGGHYL